MPRGDKSKYTDKQERKADHIAEGYLAPPAARSRAAGAGHPSLGEETGPGAGNRFVRFASALRIPT